MFFYIKGGGRILNDCLLHLALNARIAICGIISRHKTDNMNFGPEMLSKLKKTTDRKIIVIPNFSIGAAYQKLFAAALSENFKSANITFSSEEPAELKTSIKLFMT